ncbi:L-tyrosine/L-tryptophan isonitrile synthase family protein, partial [Serratia marcescens]
MDSAQKKEEIALKILRELLQYRRRLIADDASLAEEERQVTQVQLPRIRAFIENDQRIEFVLPAFPTKSPNANKVIGAVPDMAERLSLIFLNSLCQRI